MRVLITGGAGFIGSHLAEVYFAAGNDVTVIDNLSTGMKSNLSSALSSARFRIINQDVTNFAALDGLISESEVVAHLAACVGVARFIDRPIEAVAENIEAARLVMQSCAKHDKRLFFASSSEVYGELNGRDSHESDKLVLASTSDLRWGYGSSKLMGEFFGLLLNRAQGMRITIGRLFNVAGPRQSSRYGMVIPRFVEQAMRGRPLTVYGDGQQTRCFLHVADAVSIIQRLMATDVSIGHIVNIGSREMVTIYDLAREVIAVARSLSPIVCTPYETTFPPHFLDILRRRPSLRKLEELIGPVSNRPLTSIIREQVQNWGVQQESASA